MPTIGVPELVIILVIVIIVFGVGRIGEIGGAVGRGIKEFRNATKDDDTAKPAAKPDEDKKVS
jgi:sec-independent protein translocase protein TatA